MKKLYLSVIIGGLFVCFSCKKDTFCDVKDPIHDLPWLREEVRRINDLPWNTTISKGIFKEKKKIKKFEGFIISDQIPDGGFGFYSCEGEIICTGGGFDGAICKEYAIIKEEIIYSK